MTNIKLYNYKTKLIDKVILKIGILQILALVITCTIWMYMTKNDIFWEQIWLVPWHMLLVFGIIKLNDKWCNKIDNINKKNERKI